MKEDNVEGIYVKIGNDFLWSLIFNKEVQEKLEDQLG